MRVPGHQSAKAQIVVNVFVAIEIAEFAARRFGNKDRVRIIGAVIAGDAQWQAFQVFLVSLGGLRRAALESLELFLQFGIHLESPEYSGRGGH